MKTFLQTNEPTFAEERIDATDFCITVGESDGATFPKHIEITYTETDLRNMRDAIGKIRVDQTLSDQHAMYIRSVYVLLAEMCGAADDCLSEYLED